MNLTNAALDIVVTLRHLLVLLINYKIQRVELDAFPCSINKYLLLLNSSPQVGGKPS